ncbi:MAG: 50S ribosomal protein L23 [Ignavibacteria bacterium]|nr:50S ribosomal protein L23 [Ignavibacteria bacterium]
MGSLLRRPILTEKMNILKDVRQYAFEVPHDANKIEIAREIEKKFKVKVESIRTQKVKGKHKTQFRRSGRFEGRTRSWKKAIVTLKEGDVIDLLENV